MNLDKVLKKLEKLDRKRGKIEYNLRAVKAHIFVLEEKIEKEQDYLAEKLDIIEKNKPKRLTLKGEMEKLGATKIVPDNSEGKAIIAHIDAEQKLEAVRYQKAKDRAAPKPK